MVMGVEGRNGVHFNAFLCWETGLEVRLVCCSGLAVDIVRMTSRSFWMFEKSTNFWTPSPICFLVI